jgi:hypothetical protein
MDVSAEISDTLQGMAMDLLSINPVEGMASVREGVKAVSGKLDLKTALKAVAHKDLPTDVRALVTSASSSGEEFTEESMAKARIVLNSLVEKSWEELDDKIIACKDYQEMNRATFDQVTIDISRLVEQITDLERVETSLWRASQKQRCKSRRWRPNFPRRPNCTTTISPRTTKNCKSARTIWMSSNSS